MREARGRLLLSLSILPYCSFAMGSLSGPVTHCHSRTQGSASVGLLLPSTGITSTDCTWFFYLEASICMQVLKLVGHTLYQLTCLPVSLTSSPALGPMERGLKARPVCFHSDMTMLGCTREDRGLRPRACLLLLWFPRSWGLSLETITGSAGLIV